MGKKFLITVDTEADNQWDVHHEQTTENANFIPRFQELSELYGFVPTWLATYEMVMDDAFVDYMGPKKELGLAEIGMHPHAWSTPPSYLLDAQTDERPYLIEYPEDVIVAKLGFLSDAIRDRFGVLPTAHRSGRWAMDDRYAKALKSAGIVVDCSVTPHCDWSSHPGATGMSGTDYSGAPGEPYWLTSGVLEVPMTVRVMRRHLPVRTPKDLARAGRDLIRGRAQWLRPLPGVPTESLLALLDRVAAPDLGYAMFMIHSSELMPGGSPNFPDGESIEQLYGAIESVFSHAVQLGFEGAGLTDFARMEIGRMGEHVAS